MLIRGDGTACLADFGLSLMYSDVTTTSVASWTSTFHGNMRWLAPELLGESEDERPVRPSKHSDVYSFGGIMLQVCRSNPLTPNNIVDPAFRFLPVNFLIIT